MKKALCVLFTAALAGLASTSSAIGWYSNTSFSGGYAYLGRMPVYPDLLKWPHVGYGVAITYSRNRARFYGQVRMEARWEGEELPDGTMSTPPEMVVVEDWAWCSASATDYPTNSNPTVICTTDMPTTATYTGAHVYDINEFPIGYQRTAGFYYLRDTVVPGSDLIVVTQNNRVEAESRNGEINIIAISNMKVVCILSEAYYSRDFEQTVGRTLARRDTGTLEAYTPQQVQIIRDTTRPMYKPVKLEA